MADGYLTVDIVDVAYGGDGVARTPGGVVFVPGAFTGERVEITVTDRRKRFARGRLEAVLKPSPARRAPEGPVVPGMVYAGLDYAAEVALKDAQLRTLLQRIGRFAELPPMLPPVASPITLGYRNKLTVRSDGSRLGYVGEDNRTVVDVPFCPLSAAPINEALAAFRKEARPPAGSRTVFRWTPQDGVVRFPYGSDPKSLPLLHERLAGLDFEVAADAFFQVNPACAELLLADVQAKLCPCSCVLDLYCGVGLFGCVAARAGAEAVFGLETQASAVRAAKANARRLGVRGEYRCAPADTLPADMAAAPCWIVDPPRDGLSPALCRLMLRHCPEQIVYVSCGPDTLARDLKILSESYRIDSVRLFDFFPRTAHFETLCLLSRR